MTAHDPRVFAYAAGKAGRSRAARFPLDELNNQMSERLVVFTPSGAQVDALMSLARKAIPRLADNSVVHRVISHNPDTLWAIARRSHYTSSAAEGEGLNALIARPYKASNHADLCAHFRRSVRYAPQSNPFASWAFLASC